MYVHTYVHTCIYIYIYIHTYPYIHIPIRGLTFFWDRAPSARARFFTRRGDDRKRQASREVKSRTPNPPKIAPSTAA